MLPNWPSDRLVSNMLLGPESTHAVVLMSATVFDADGCLRIQSVNRVFRLALTKYWALAEGVKQTGTDPILGVHGFAGLAGFSGLVST
jgi:hypothetical protein